MAGGGGAVNVEERKQQARLFEQQGEFADALEFYEAALSELEGTPEIWRELPLYVKAGDLSLKMGDSSAAISHYEKAARAYAAYGSSKSVIALCTKILRVNPGHTHAFLRLVRLMIERDHLADARLVLLEYAGRMKLPKAGFVLEGMADRPDEELKPLLELLLELGGRYEYARAQGRDATDEAEAVAGQSEPGADETVEDSADTSTDETKSFSSEEQLEHRLTTHSDEDDVDEPLDDSGPEKPFQPEIEPEPEEEAESEGEQELVSEETPAPEGAASPSEDDVQWVDDRASLQTTAPRASRQVLFRELESRKSKSKALWIGLGAAAIIVVGGLSLLLFGVIPLGSDNAAEGSPPGLPVVDPADSALLAGVDLTDSTGVAVDSVATEESETAAGEAEAAAGQDSVLTGGDDAAEAGVAESDSAGAGEPIADSGATDQPELVDQLPAAEGFPELPTSRGVKVLDFDIESSTEFTADGRVGYRITQVLGTGELLTLSAVYYGDDIRSAPGTEEMTLAPLAGDTTTAMIQFNGYAVDARAIVSASVLEALLARLAEVPTSN